MKALLVAVLLAAAGLSPLLSALPAPVYACSAGPDWDPIAESDVIVEGRILGWTESPAGRHVGGFVPISVNIAVEKVAKGVAAGQLAVFDNASLLATNDPSSRRWAGASGACGAFDENPTGRYVIMGLFEDETGGLRANRLLIFYAGDGPGGDAYEQALARLGDARLSIRPPATGDAGLRGPGNRQAAW